MRKTLAALVLASLGCTSPSEIPRSTAGQETTSRSIAIVDTQVPTLSENYFLATPHRMSRRIIDRRLDMDDDGLFLGISFDVHRGDQISALVDGERVTMVGKDSGSWSEYRLLLNAPGLPKFHRPGAIELGLGDHVLDIEIRDTSGQMATRRYEFSLQGEIIQDQGVIFLYDGSLAAALSPQIKEDISDIIAQVNAKTPGAIDLVNIPPTTNLGSAYYGRGRIVLPIDHYVTGHSSLDDQLRSIQETLYHEGGHGVFDVAFLDLARIDEDGCRRSYIIGEAPINTRNQELYQQWLSLFGTISEQGRINIYKDSNFGIEPRAGHPHDNPDEFFASCFMIRECGYIDAFRQRQDYREANEQTKQLLDRPFELMDEVIWAVSPR